MEEVGKLCFWPVISNREDLEKAKTMDSDGNLCTFNNLITPKQPVIMEYDALEKAI